MTPHKQPRRQSPAGPRGTGTEANRPSSKLRIHLADQRHEYYNKYIFVGTSPNESNGLAPENTLPASAARSSRWTRLHTARSPTCTAAATAVRTLALPSPGRFKPTGGPGRLRKEQRCHKTQKHPFFCLEERLRGQRVHIYATRASSGY